MTIPIFYTISDDYTPYTAISVQLLTGHADPNEDYTTAPPVQNISDVYKKDLESLSTKDVRANIFHIDNEMVAPIHNSEENYLRAQFFTTFTFYRLFIPNPFPQYDKAVYLDAGTIICIDIVELYNTEIGDNMFVNMPDMSIRFIKPLQIYIKRCQGTLSPEKYTSNGVILFNMKASRDKKFVDRSYSLIEKYHLNNIDSDQAYINEICEDKVYHLPPEWDAMPNEHMDEVKNPKIVRYNLFFKPWYLPDVQYNKYFWGVAKRSPCYEELRAQLASFTDEDRRRARTDLNQMIREVGEIKDEDVIWVRVKKTMSVKI